MKNIKADRVENILKIEFEMMQNTQNIGGRASCQDDWETFYIMRGSQYASWRDDMLEFWEKFVEECRAEGRNMVTEKYAKMMRFTHPEYYKQNLEPFLPETPSESFPLIDEIVKAMIEWELDFAEKYPKISGAGRPITADQDKYGFTSLETYARGELETYPLELLKMYADYVRELLAEEKSLAMINQGIMVKMYGYETIEDAEASLSCR